jgi:transglutaminase-like putative cysteine protease
MIGHDGLPFLPFVRPGQFVDSDHPSIHDFANRAIFGAATAVDRAVALYYAVRDGIRYDVYVDYTDPASFRASGVLAAGRGFCVGKAAVLAACCRAVGIPARLGYADVRNHVTSPRLKALMRTNVFRWHSFAELFLLDRWVKATPAFDRPLCERAGLMPLEFDGRADSLFQPFDTQGQRHMEYLVWRGSFADVPFEAILSDFRLHYPSLISDMHGTGEDFRKAVTTTAG